METYNKSKPAYRSAGERRVGEFLEEAGIPFEHEAPILVRDRGKPKIWYPDFYLPDFHTIIEYFGVEGDPAYERVKRRKRAAYRANRIPAIYMGPRNLSLD